MNISVCTDCHLKGQIRAPRHKGPDRIDPCACLPFRFLPSRDSVASCVHQTQHRKKGQKKRGGVCSTKDSHCTHTRWVGVYQPARVKKSFATE